MKNYTIEDLQLIAENLPREDLTKIKTRIKKIKFTIYIFKTFY
jgi:hypothetical protein